MAEPEYAIVGRVRKSHGVRGDVVVELHTDAPEAIFASGRRVFGGTVAGDVARGRDGAPTALTVRGVRPFKGGLIVSFDRIADRNEADLWRDRYLLVLADELTPPADDEVFYHDLIGMEVRLTSGEVVGPVEALFELPQGLMLDVRTAGGGTELVPYRPDLVTGVDLAARVITIDPPEGLLG